MLTLANTSHSSTSAFLNSAMDTFEHYGFEPISKSLRNIKPKNKPPKKIAIMRDIAYVHPHERKLANLTKVCLNANLGTEGVEPKLLYQYDSPRKGVARASIGLHVVGVLGTVAEITVLSTVNTLLKKIAVQAPVVHINSIGDRDSKTRFVRELTAYLRSVFKDLPPYAINDLEQKNSLLALAHLAERQHPVARAAPNPMEYLNDESRSRLRKILEYMEHADINYELNPALVGSGDCWTHTIFEVRAPNEGVYVPLVRGGRYNTLARRAYGKKLASVGAIIEYEIRGRTVPKQRKKVVPKFFITYIGEQARVRAFSILEDFYNAGIPIGKSISHSHISGQIDASEKMCVPYLLIIGHKEALEDTAIIRNTKTRTQKVIPVSQLISYVSRLKV